MTGSSIAMVAAVMICFLALVLNLTVSGRHRRDLTRCALILVFLIGTVFYGYGYAWCEGIHVSSLIRALLAVCRMFAGYNDLSAVKDAPIFQSQAMLDIFWLGHFLAFYVMASATIAALGERLLRRIRAMLLRRGPLLLVYGVNPRALAYGRRMATEKKRSVVFVDPEREGGAESAVRAIGGVLEDDDDARGATVRFLRRFNMRAGNRKMEVAALHQNGRKNLEYARALQESMGKLGIRPEQVSLLAAGYENTASTMQSLEGYGSVYAFDGHDLTARMIMRDHPPCDQIRFDETGRATENFHAVIVGFGRMGRAVLKALVMNGQFCGSHFQADVFDPGPQNGFLYDHPMMRQYDIRFHSASSTGEEFYAFLEENRHQIRMIVLCTGDTDQNREIAADLAGWFHENEEMPLTVYVTLDRYCWLDADRCEVQSPHFFDSEGLDLEQMDAMAIQVNQIYREDMGSTLSAGENWLKCDYRSRQACRASADFYPAMLRGSGKTEEQVLAGDWPPEKEVLENLAITEHLRWSAAQYAAGYSAMPREIWEERARRYRAEKEAGKEPAWRITRDDRTRMQGCLIPWEELDNLSARENAVTGGHVDYKQFDRNNVVVLSRALAARKGNGGADHG